ncbi:sugar phosphate isomerase/epimerase [candidate division KSB1 bacterium]|nr:sugar phosphate isomerase/epimerase [candidate division KSB1 bacterium]
MIELAIVSDEIALDIREALRYGLDWGFRKYELRCIGSYEKRIPFVDKNDIEFIEQLLQDRKIEITALSPGTFKIMPSQEKELEFQLTKTLPQTFALAHRLKVKKIITFGFLRDQTTENRVIELIARAGEMAAKEDLLLVVENEPGAYCDTGANTARIIRSIGMENVLINWDPGNALSSGEVPFPNGYAHVKPYIANLHIKDGVAEPKIEMRLINDGGVNWLGQLTALLREPVLPFLTLETHVFPLIESTRTDLTRLRTILQAAEILANES